MSDDPSPFSEPRPDTHYRALPMPTPLDIALDVLIAQGFNAQVEEIRALRRRAQAAEQEQWRTAEDLPWLYIAVYPQSPLRFRRPWIRDLVGDVTAGIGSFPPTVYKQCPTCINRFRSPWPPRERVSDRDGTVRIVMMEGRKWSLGAEQRMVFVGVCDECGTLLWDVVRNCIEG